MQKKDEKETLINEPVKIEDGQVNTLKSSHKAKQILVIAAVCSTLVASIAFGITKQNEEKSSYAKNYAEIKGIEAGEEISQVVVRRDLQKMAERSDIEKALQHTFSLGTQLVDQTQIKKVSLKEENPINHLLLLQPGTKEQEEQILKLSAELAQSQEDLHNVQKDVHIAEMNHKSLQKKIEESQELLAAEKMANDRLNNIINDLTNKLAIVTANMSSYAGATPLQEQTLLQKFNKKIQNLQQEVSKLSDEKYALHKKLAENEKNSSVKKSQADIFCAGSMQADAIAMSEKKSAAITTDKTSTLPEINNKSSEKEVEGMSQRKQLRHMVQTLISQQQSQTQNVAAFKATLDESIIKTQALKTKLKGYQEVLNQHQKQFNEITLATRKKASSINKKKTSPNFSAEKNRVKKLDTQLSNELDRYQNLQSQSEALHKKIGEITDQLVALHDEINSNKSK